MSTNDFMQKKLFNKIIHSPYTLIFHYNTIRSKDWRIVKEKLFQVRNKQAKSTPSALLGLTKQVSSTQLTTAVVPLRILTKISSSAGITTDFAHLPSTGSSCLFFCESIEESKIILGIVQSSFIDKTEPSRTKVSGTNLNQFLTLGILKVEGLDKKISFFNTYELLELLNLTLDREITQVVNSITKNLNSLSSFDKIFATSLTFPLDKIKLNLGFTLAEVIKIHQNPLEETKHL